jgi:hypothetical protein
MVVLTGGLVVVAAGQLGTYIVQARYMKRTLAVAQASADAAKAAVINLERPWIVIEPDGDPADIMDMGGGRGKDKQSFMIQYRVSNLGRSPAWFISEATDCVVVPLPCPPAQPYPATQAAAKFSRDPLAAGKRRKVGGEHVVLDAKQRAAMLRQEAALMAYGVVTYRDAFGNLHETGFCWLFHRPAVPFSESSPTLTGWNESPWIVLDGPETYMRHT